MSIYRRNYVAGGFYFITVVTYNRRPILTDEPGRLLLRESILETQENYPFEIFATVLLPDHWHFILKLPEQDADYSTRIKRTKEVFTRKWLANGLPEAAVTSAQRSKGERGIWQPRFWEHTIVEPVDLERCVDYIHWNPRKHNLVKRVKDYPWSSFHRFVKMGQYDADWGGEEPSELQSPMDWGEP